MLSGILLDTNYYRRQTGIRTYESSAFLKEYGASTEDADNFLKDDYEEIYIVDAPSAFCCSIRMVSGRPSGCAQGQQGLP